MSVDVLGAVWRRSAASTPAEIAVLAGLADWADQWGYCYASLAAIAKRARVSERQVHRVIAKFVTGGELTKSHKGHRVSAPGHRPGRTGLQPRNFYRFTCVPDDTPDQEREDAMSPLPAADEPRIRKQRGDMASHKEVTPRPAYIRNNRQINTRQILKAGGDPALPDKRDEHHDDDGPEKNLGVITRLAHEVFDVIGTRADLGELAETVKSRCAKLHVAYDADTIRKAIDSALWQRAHRRAAQ